LFLRKTDGRDGNLFCSPGIFYFFSFLIYLIISNPGIRQHPPVRTYVILIHPGIGLKLSVIFSEIVPTAVQLLPASCRVTGSVKIIPFMSDQLPFIFRPATILLLIPPACIIFLPSCSMNWNYGRQSYHNRSQKKSAQPFYSFFHIIFPFFFLKTVL